MLCENIASSKLWEKNLDKITDEISYSLSTNAGVIDLLELHQDKVHKDTIWENPAIFEPEVDHFALLMQVRF
jgi:hypothetical protein